MIFGIGPAEVVSLIVLGLILFGPDKLPKIISEIMGFIRKIQAYSDQTKQEIRGELGSGFEDFDFQDLNPKVFVQKQLTNHGDRLGRRPE